MTSYTRVLRLLKSSFPKEVLPGLDSTPALMPVLPPLGHSTPPLVPVLSLEHRAPGETQQNAPALTFMLGCTVFKAYLSESVPLAYAQVLHDVLWPPQTPQTAGEAGAGQEPTAAPELAGPAPATAMSPGAGGGTGCRM